MVSNLRSTCWVSTGTGDHMWVGKLSSYITSHLDQLSLAIPQWVGTMSSRLRATRWRPCRSSCSLLWTMDGRI